MSRSANRIKVCIRVRPTANFAQDNLLVDQDNHKVRLTLPDHSADGHGAGAGDVMSNRRDTYNFQFHNVLHNAGQDTVYETLTRGIVTDSVRGRNGTIMAYGQTGAGKTFTMLGNLNHYHQRGLIPRAISNLFQEIEQRDEYVYRIRCSYLELYNERIFDLLGEKTGTTKAWTIADDTRGGKGMHVKGLTVVECKTEEDVLNCLFKGAEMRTISQHVLNSTSNRSHCIFTVYMEQRSRLGSSEKVVHSKLNLVDLAGSERLKKVDVEDVTSGGKAIDGTTKRESMYINRSLTYLEQCVVALTTRGRAHVPYRQTKLTHLLKDGIGGNSNSLMLACIYGEEAHLEETLSTLRLAQRMMRVENKVEEVSTVDSRLRIKQLERQVKALKQELMMHDALAERSGITYDEYTPEQRHEVATSVRKFLDTDDGASDDPIGSAFGSIRSMRHVAEILLQFKLIVRNVESKTEERLRQRFTMAPRAGGEAAGAAPAAEDVGAGGDGAGGDGAGGETGAAGAGDIEGGTGYGVGLAAAQARPASIDMGELSPVRDGAGRPVSPVSPGSPGSRAPESPTASPKVRAKPVARGSTAIPDSKAEAFALFKQMEGLDLNEVLRSRKREFKGLQRSSRRLRAQLNEHKHSIDALQSQIEIKRKESSAVLANKTDDGEDIIDEEEFRLMREQQHHKRSYRSIFADYKDVAMRLSGADKAVQQARSNLVDAFDQWYAMATGETMLDAAKDVTNDDRLDEGEMFEKMEMERVMDDDPESVAFFLAQKQRSKARRKDHGSTARAIRDKRLNK